MTKHLILTLSICTALFTGCAMDATGDNASLVESPNFGDDVERIESRSALVYERFEHAEAVLEVTAIPNLDDPSFWDNVELIYFDGQDESVLVTSLGPDLASDPELEAFLNRIDPNIIDQLREIRRFEYTVQDVAPAPAHAELLWTLYDQLGDAQSDMSDTQLEVTVDTNCVELRGNYWECFDLVVR